MNEMPQDVKQWLVDSGWEPNREVAVPDSLPRNHPAWDVLRSFGGLKLLERNCEPEDDPIEEFVFGAFPSDDHRTARKWSQLLKSPLVKIAQVHNDHGELYMDGTGRCFGNSLMHDAFWFEGQSFVDLLQGHLANRRGRPMLRPWQRFVWLYGEKITRDDPRVYDYRTAK
jgi:hypothetical protein